MSWAYEPVLSPFPSLFALLMGLWAVYPKLMMCLPGGWALPLIRDIRQSGFQSSLPKVVVLVVAGLPGALLLLDWSAPSSLDLGLATIALCLTVWILLGTQATLGRRLLLSLGLLLLLFLPWLAGVALVLTGLTIWTYMGTPGVRAGRIVAMVGLRLLALVLALLMILRPSLGFHNDPRLPSTLLIVLDASGSMTIQDEFDGKARWDYLRRVLNDCEPTLNQLQEEQNVTIALYAFGEDVHDFDPAKDQPDGKRTDMGLMLHTLIERHGQDRNLRDLLLLSDGADNGSRFSAVSEAARWRSLSCPIQTFGFGKPTTAEGQSDIAFTAIYAEPAPVAIKGKLTVRGILNAPGFENKKVTVHLFLDDKEVLAQEETLAKTTGNEVKLVTDAPASAGEVKVTLKIDHLEKDQNEKNDVIDTFVTVTKEGISVLLVDKLRFPEPQRICDALSPDPRIRLYVGWRRTDEPASDQADLFQFDKQRYDVIILGDLTAKRLSAGHPQALAQIQDLVRKGAGLMMMGGQDSFDSDWKNTPIEDMLPVKLDVAGQVPDEVQLQMEPTPDGLKHYLMRLAERPEENVTLWKNLPRLTGMTQLGTPKSGAAVLAVRAGTAEPMLVGQRYGEGRTLAFAGDTTWRWQRLGQPKSSEGLKAHERFWKQVVLWLARQEETEGNVWIKPEARRISAGSKLNFTVGLRGKGGVDLKDGNFEVVAINPNKVEDKLRVDHEQEADRGTLWKTDVPGEYLLKVRGRGKDADGTEAGGEASARVVVYQEDTEMARRAAAHDFLATLANNGGGKFHEAKELPGFLKELQKQPLAQAQQKTEHWPVWKRDKVSGFLVGFLFLFVGVLCVEWFLRRFWGMV